MNKILSLLREPRSLEKRRLLDARWNELPEDLRVGWQVVGRQMVHCGFTLGPSYCAFGCSHCYLPANANKVPLPSLDDMKAQIDANRRLMGPSSGLQITGGDVLDAYFRAGRPEELVAVLRYANDAGVVPMVMTHGQKLLEHPDFLDRLVVEGGLRKVAIHIDVTQAGRPGFPWRQLTSEADLHPLRQQFVDLVLGCRERTGVRFSAAHTLTVTERNLGDVGEVIRWLLADRRRLDAFRMLSLQPEADVGRTRASANPATAEATWRAVETAVGRRLAPDNFWFGHPDCSHMVTLAVLEPSGRLVNATPGDAESRQFWSAVLASFGGVGFRGESQLLANLERLNLVLRRPRMIARTVAYARHLLRRQGVGVLDALRHLVAGRVGVLNIVQHNFMDADRIRERSPVVAKRLAACSFRGAVERDGEWHAVPMCAMNVEERQDLYARRIAGAAVSPAPATPPAPS